MRLAGYTYICAYAVPVYYIFIYFNDLLFRIVTLQTILSVFDNNISLLNTDCKKLLNNILIIQHVFFWHYCFRREELTVEAL